MKLTTITLFASLAALGSALNYAVPAGSSIQLCDSKQLPVVDAPFLFSALKYHNLSIPELPSFNGSCLPEPFVSECTDKLAQAGRLLPAVQDIASSFERRYAAAGGSKALAERARTGPFNVDGEIVKAENEAKSKWLCDSADSPSSCRACATASASKFAISAALCGLKETWAEAAGCVAALSPAFFLDYQTCLYR